MATNAYNVGRDVTLDILDPVQGPLRFRLMTSFDHTPMYKSLESNALDGVPRFAELPAGHELTFEFDRADSQIQDYFAGQELAYFNGQALPNVSVTETVTNVDGSISVYQFTGVAMRLTKGVAAKGDSIVTQTVAAKASRLYRLQ